MTNIVLIQRSFGQRHISVVPEEDAPKFLFTENDAFEAFNGYGPHADLRRYAHYSMSVDDIVGIDGVWYRCDRFGWTNLSQDGVSRIVTEMLFG